MFWIPGCETLKLMMKKLWLIWKLFDRIFYSVCIWHYTNCIWPPISCTYDLVNGSCFNAIQATHVGLDVAARTVYQSKQISSNQNKQTSVKWQMLELVHMHTCRLFQQEMDSHKSHYCFVEMRVPALNIFSFSYICTVTETSMRHQWNAGRFTQNLSCFDLPRFTRMCLWLIDVHARGQERAWWDAPITHSCQQQEPVCQRQKTNS